MSKRAESQTSQNHETMDRDRQRLSTSAKGRDPSAARRPRWRSSMVEQLICNQQVAGSSPIASSKQIAWAQPGFARRSPSRESLRTLPGFAKINGRVPEWPKGTDCKSVVSDFEGSNPSPSTSAVTGRRLFTRGFAWAQLGFARRSPSRESSRTLRGFSTGAWAQLGFARRSPSRESSRTLRGFSTGMSAGVAQLVELQPSKLDVAGSRPVSRSILNDNDNHMNLAHVAQLAEHVLGKDEVTRSIRVVGSRAVAKVSR
jgi:hypothetical protein